jgi:flagellar hook-length control protein FliK
MGTMNVDTMGISCAPSMAGTQNTANSDVEGSGELFLSCLKSEMGNTAADKSIEQYLKDTIGFEYTPFDRETVNFEFSIALDTKQLKGLCEDDIRDFSELWRIFRDYEKGLIGEEAKLLAIQEILSRRAQNSNGNSGEYSKENNREYSNIHNKTGTADGETEVSATKGGEQYVPNAHIANLQSMQNLQNEQIDIAKIVQNVENIQTNAVLDLTQSTYGGTSKTLHQPIPNPTQELNQGNVKADFVQVAQNQPTSQNQSETAKQMLEVPREAADEAEKTAKFSGKSAETQESKNSLAFSKEISKDIGSYEVTKKGQKSSGETQDRPQDQLAELKKMAGAYRPEVKDISELKEFVGEVKPSDAGAVTAETVTSEVSWQSVAVQVSNSIIENLEKITKAMEMPKFSQSAQLPQTSATNVPNSADRFNTIITKTEVTEFKITLNPEHLGKVTVKLTTDGVKMSVLIITANDQVRDLLLARMQSVRVMVEITGVTVERYEVVTQGQNHAVTSASETQRDILDDKENGNNQQDTKEQDDSEDETEMSFSELIGTMV